MHELSIAQSIVDIIRQYVPEEQEPEVKLVKIRVGQMAGVVPDSLDFCFEAIVKDTPLGNARLDIEAVPLQSECKVCHEVFAVEGACFVCPHCGGGEIRLISGTELQVVEIEVSEPRPGVV
jgi:hydrogenase nickel incorporation protein HypA/HybF